MSTTGPEIGQAIADNHLIDGLPNWESIDFDITCSRCGYNLRMLTKPKCTECGFEFDWREMITRHFNINPDLFEHGWRRSPSRTYLATVLLPIVRPIHFWNRISLHDKIRPRPLVFLILTAPLTLAATLLASAAVTTLLIDSINGVTADTRRLYVSGYASSPSLLLEYFIGISTSMDTLVTYALRRPDEVAIGLLFTLCFLVIVLATLASLKETIARCKLRKGHMLRAVAYAATPSCLLLAFVGYWIPWVKNLYDIGIRPPPDFRWIAPAAFLALIGASVIYQLYLPLKRYLSVPTPLLVAFLITIVGVLGTSVASLFLADIL